MFKKILVPLDWLELSKSVLPYVRELAICTGAEVVLLHVAQDPVYESNVADTMISAPLNANVTAIHFEYRGYLEAAAAGLKEAGIMVSIVLRVGEAAETILTYADEMHADLIAMSTHGRTGVSRLLLGSVAEKVVHGAKIPVLLLRPQEQADAVTVPTQA